MPSQRELAAAEDAAWRTRVGSLPGEDPAQYIARVTGSPLNATENRRLLHLMGEVAAPLWARIEGGMSPGMAVGILRRHASRADRPRWGDLSVAEVEAALAAHDRERRKGHEVQTADGRTYRRRALGKHRRVATWEGLRESVRAFCRAELGEVGGAEAGRIVSEFEAELGSLLSDFRSRVSRARRSYGGAAFAGVTRATLERACDELGVARPTRGMIVDMREARSRKRALVKRYHPDVTGDESSRPMLEGVVAAFKVLEDYNEQVGGEDAARREEGAVGHGG